MAAISMTIRVRTRGVRFASLHIRLVALVMRVSPRAADMLARPLGFWLKVEAGKRPRWKYINIGARVRSILHD